MAVIVIKQHVRKSPGQGRQHAIRRCAKWRRQKALLDPLGDRDIDRLPKLFSIVDAGEGALQARIDEEIIGSRTASDVEELVATLRSGAGGGSAAAMYNSKVSQMQPTLVIRSGYRFNVLVADDIMLERWNG
jgi:hypothetical protein